MKVTYNWLKEMTGVLAPAEDIAKRLTSAGMEVEEIIYQNEHLHDVVVGKILKIEKHPQADRLVVCQVSIGQEIVQIITAATNVFEGAIVPVSLPGADLVNGVKIQKAKMRGVESCGMFCSGEELGIDENYFEGAGVNGILILPSDFKVGQPIEDALMLNDVIFDIGITPNRADCMSVVGVAREVCALYGITMGKINCNYDIDIYSKDTVRNYVNVDVNTPNCYRYMTSAITDVKLERSPLWMRARLNAVGIKPINTIVDITNYVLIEMGQPLHAFDQKQIKGGKIEVRQACEGESIDTLNHNTYKLDDSVMVVCDEEKPIVIAGVIGGTNSCINEDTKVCVLESAVFDLKSIRVTSRKYGISTDSSARFSKGVNVANAELGLARALHLVNKLKCGKVVRGVIDIASKKNEERHIEGSVSKINQILGVEIPAQDMVRILNNLSIKTTLAGDKLSCVVPPYRVDIENNNDLAEEVIRMYGYDVYDKLDYKLFDHAKITEGQQNPKLALERKLRNALAEKGFYENISFTLCGSDTAEKLLIEDDRKNLVRIANPLGEELSCMRPSLAQSLLDNVAYNLSVGNKSLRLFECGRVYKSLGKDVLPEEKDMLAVCVYENGYDFFKLKGVMQSILNKVSGQVSIERSTEPYLHPGVSADIYVDGKKVGCFGKIHPVVAENYDLPHDVFYGEVNTGYLASLPIKKYTVKPISKFPIVERDIAVVVSEDISVGDMLDAIKSACGKLYYEASLFDIYRSETLGQNMKSVAFNVKLWPEDKTLTDEEVANVMKKIEKGLAYKFGASLR